MSAKFFGSFLVRLISAGTSQSSISSQTGHMHTPERRSIIYPCTDDSRNVRLEGTEREEYRGFREATEY